MRILNFSRIPTKEIRKLARFVFKLVPQEVILFTEIHIRRQ